MSITLLIVSRMLLHEHQPLYPRSTLSEEARESDRLTFLRVNRSLAMTVHKTNKYSHSIVNIIDATNTV
jgi:hypothetical protein